MIARLDKNENQWEYIKVIQFWQDVVDTAEKSTSILIFLLPIRLTIMFSDNILIQN